MSMAQVLKLKPAFSDEQAQALAGLFDEALATKADTEQLRVAVKADTEQLRVSVRADIERLDAKLTSEITKVKLEVEKLRLEVQRDIKSVEARLIAWVVGQGAAVIGILFALLHFTGK